MDPDIPIPSLENEATLEPVSTSLPEVTMHSGNTPLRRPSPDKPKMNVKKPVSNTSSPILNIPRSSSRSSTPNHDMYPSPVLQTKRSNSNLSGDKGNTPSRQQFRRTSSNLNPQSPAGNSNLNMSDRIIIPTPMTAASVAKDYFRREIEALSQNQNKVVVFIHDSCYGHRFSRPKTSKAALSTIVERPERILATILGASTAYVRLGGRHAQGVNGPHPERDLVSTPPPPFVLRKTTRSIALDHPAVTSIHGLKWMEELQIMCDTAEAKLAMNGKDLVRPIGYGKNEAGHPLPKLHEGDLYLCSESLAALQGCLGGVCDAIDAVFSPDSTSRAFVNIRPPGHHCSSDVPSGFCWLNNVHVGISYAALNHNLTHAAIIDFDLHHGDGSQTIAWDHNRTAQKLSKNAPSHKKTPIGYYSLHDINSYPCEWGDEEKVLNASLCIQNAHGQSIWNVHLEPWTSLDQFWQLYKSKYMVLLEKTRLFLKCHSDRLRQSGVQPKAAIFLSAGFDASQWESEGMQRHKVNVPTEFYAKFTEDIVKLAEENGLGVDGRVISVLEGGYSDRALTSGVLSHLCGLTTSQSTIDSESNEKPGLTATVNNAVEAVHVSKTYDPTWWAEANLQALEDMVAGNAPPPPKKTAKQSSNYSSPTQASTMKMTENARERQSLSAQVEARLTLANATPEPPPEVDWVTASYELSRLLIPNDRQTLSCRHDELNAEATKARRERQSLLATTAPTEEKMQLRDRKSKPMPTKVAARPARSRSSNRRTTIAAVSELPDPSMGGPPTQPRRRSSAASSILSTFQDMKIDDASKDIDLQLASVSETKPMFQKPRPVEVSKERPIAVARQTRSRSRDRENKLSTGITGVGSGASSVQGASIELDTRSSSQSRQSSVGSVGTNGIDDITKGIQKVSIKLKMPTPEQHAANQKKAEEQVQQQRKPTKKPPTSRTTKLKSKPASIPVPTSKGRVANKANPSTIARQPLSTTAQNAISKPGAEVEFRKGRPQTQTMINSSSGNSHSAMLDPTQGVRPIEHAEIPVEVSKVSYVSEVSEASETSKTPEDLRVDKQVSALSALDNVEERQTAGNVQQNNMSSEDSVPPRPSAPTPAASVQTYNTPARRSKDDLPVFTANTPIPFATGVNIGMTKSSDGNSKLPRSVWDLPDTPKQ